MHVNLTRTAQLKLNRSYFFLCIRVMTNTSIYRFIETVQINSGFVRWLTRFPPGKRIWIQNGSYSYGLTPGDPGAWTLNVKKCIMTSPDITQCVSSVTSLSCGRSSKAVMRRTPANCGRWAHEFREFQKAFGNITSRSRCLSVWGLISGGEEKKEKHNEPVRDWSGWGCSSSHWAGGRNSSPALSSPPKATTGNQLRAVETYDWTTQKGNITSSLIMEYPQTVTLIVAVTRHN